MSGGYGRGKSITAMLILSMFLLVLMPGESAFAEEMKTVRFADTPFPPYTVGVIGQPPTGGYAVQLLSEIFSRLGVDIEVTLYPWKRTLKLVQFGRADGIPLLMRSRERERFLAFTDVLFETREVLYYQPERLSHFVWQSYADLKPYTIGLVSGYTYGQAFLRAVEELGLQVTYASSSQQNFRLLNAKRVDLCLEEEMVAQSFMAQNEQWKNSFKAAAKPVTVYPYYMAFSKRSQAVVLLPQINRIIAELKRDGTIDRILGRSK